MKIWEHECYPKIASKINDEYIGKGNLTSNLWKNNMKEPTSDRIRTNENRKQATIAIYLSSTDEAYNDDGTLLLETQMLLVRNLIELKRRGVIGKIIVKPHPDTISRIDLTIQHSIVTALIKGGDNIDICWPESKETTENITNWADIIIVPHSSIAIELASKGVTVLTFQDSPFREVGQRVIGIGEITDIDLLERIIDRHMKEEIGTVIHQEGKKRTLEKLELSWLLWDSIKIPWEIFLKKDIDRSMDRAEQYIKSIGKLEKTKELNMCSLRVLFIQQAKV